MIKNTKMPAYSLLEIAIYLTIVGILSMSVLKGQKILYQAKIEKTVAQVEALKLAIDQFKNTYGALPGEYNGSQLGSDVGNGDGDGKIEVNEEQLFWSHLELSELAVVRQIATGGLFSIIKNVRPGWHAIVLEGPGESGIFTKANAEKIKAKLGNDGVEIKPASGDKFRVFVYFQ